MIEGTGGVGLFGLQIAKARGTIAIMSGSTDRLARAKALGADQCIDQRNADLVETVYKITGDRGADHVLEVIGVTHLGKAAQVAAVGGHICLVGALASCELPAPLMPLLLKDVTIHGVGTGHRCALDDLVRAVDRTGLKPVIDTRFPMSALPEALDHLDRGAFGQIVIELS